MLRLPVTGTFALVLASLLLVAAAPARAHQSSIAYSEIAVDGRDLDYTLQIASTDLYEAIGIDKDRPVTRSEVEAGRARLFDYLAAHLHVREGQSFDKSDCPAEPGGLEFIDKEGGFFAAAKLHFRCPRTVEKASIRYDLFFDLDPRHQGIARVTFAGDDEGKERQQIFRDSARTVEISRDLSVWDHARDYLVLGIEHIFTGYDHIAFLFGLLAVCGAHGLRRGARRILGVVTAFTLAHSVTLISSALGFITLPSRLVEPAIALSIVYVGVENLVQPEPRHRWLLTFGFGLIHGFGFASVLKEIGLPSKGVWLSLLSFNVGVEIGQLAVVAAVLPLLSMIARPRPLSAMAARAGEWLLVAFAAAATFLLFRAFHAAGVPLAVVVFVGAPLLYGLGRRYGYDRVVRLGGSAVISALAAFWFFERVNEHALLRGILG